MVDTNRAFRCYLVLNNLSYVIVRTLLVYQERDLLFFGVAPGLRGHLFIANQIIEIPMSNHSTIRLKIQIIIL